MPSLYGSLSRTTETSSEYDYDINTFLSALDISDVTPRHISISMSFEGDKPTRITLKVKHK